MKRSLGLTLIFVLALVVFKVYGQDSIPQYSIPQPPTLTGDALFKMYGQCQADKNLQTDYANTLRSEVARLNAEIEKLKNPVKAEKK